MKKIFKKIFVFMILFSTFIGGVFANNRLLDKLDDSKGIDLDAKDVFELSLNIADSIANIFLVIAIIFFFIIIIKLIISENSEEESENFKKGFIWISIGILVIQTAKTFVSSIYVNTNQINSGIASIAQNLLDNLIKPFTNLLELGVSFFFLMIAIYTFYKLITSNGNDESLKNAKNTIFYSIVGFILVKVSYALINSVYGNCDRTNIIGAKCDRKTDLNGISEIITNLINWMNSFIGIGIVIILIYSGLQIIFSNGDEDKINNGKKGLLFIIIGIGILIMNYLIVTFFLNINP